ncbi:VWA domain-containing protein [Lachnospiraceae bacterium 46-61]
MENNNQTMVYIILDCSSSMIGEPIESVRQAIKEMIAEWKEEEANIVISVLVYQTVARELLKDVALTEFVLPHFIMGGLSCLSKAFTLLSDIIKKNKEQNKKPLVFLFTDGKIMDIDKDIIKNYDVLKKVNFVLCEAGAETNTYDLKTIIKHTISLNTLTYGEFKSYL